MKALLSLFALSLIATGLIGLLTMTYWPMRRLPWRYACWR
jgi:hypothetical protein